MIKRLGTAAALGLLLLAIAGCATGFRLRATIELPVRSTSQITPLDNNQTLTLDSANYSGNLTIRANQVTIRGQGGQNSIIDGDVTIHGNGVTISRVRINGDVILHGNNNSLSGTIIRGQIRDHGNNNRF
ncbi:MAG: hypothetical protein ACOCVC_06950 [Spirochaeta sp.]